MDEMAQYYEGYGTDAWIHARAKYEPEYLDMLQKGGPSANTRFQSKFLAIQKFLQYTPLPNKGRLLDFGGGSGDAIAPIFSSFEKYSFDIAGLPVVEGCTSVTSLENLEAFDVVLCQEVLEHVPSPNDILTDISNVLKPHSYLFITVPLEVADNLSDLSEGLVFHEHINKFTSESLSTLQRKNGFIIEKLAVCEFEIFGQSNTSIFSLARLSY
jgi:SAM-dependent methyltransferase